MTEIKQSSASRALVFKLVAASDGYTAVTSAMPTVQIRKEGGSFISPNGAVTEINNGFYQVAANATDTNTLGTLLLHATAVGARPADMAYDIVANTAADVVAAVSALNDITATEAAAAVRLELTTELSRIDTTVSSRATPTTVWSAATRTLTDQSDSAGVTTLLTRLPGAITLAGGKVTVGTNDDKSGYALATAPPTAAAIADAVWDEPTAGHVAAGSTGAAIIAAAAGGGGGGATPAEIADAVWDEALSGHVIAGSAGAGLAAASASGDPWASLLPGSYAEGTAGAGIGRLNLVPGDGPVIVIPDPSEDPGQCVIYVSTRDIDGTITPGVRIRITPRNGPATTAGGQLVGMTPFDLITDADGFASAVVERVDLLTPENTLYYQVTATRYALDTTISPTTALFDLATIIVP